MYGISRRMVGTLAISNVVGLSLARYLALQADEMVRRAHLVVAAGLALLPGILLLAAGALAPGFWAGLVFDDRTQGPALLSMLFLVLATASFNLLFAHYRGTNRVTIGNRFNVALVGIGPMLVALVSASTGSTAVVNTLSAGVMLIALVVLAPEIWGAFRASGAALRASCFREQWAFVWPRIPGGFAIGSLASVAPVLAPRFATTTAAGYLVAGQVLLRLVDAGTAAFGVVALPKVAELHARGQAAFIRARVGDVIAMAVHLGLFFTFHLLVWADVIVTAWLGERYAPAVPVIRVVLCSVAPYTAYTLLRSVIDVLDERAVNARNTYAAFAMTVVAALALGYGAMGPPAWPPPARRG
ncbi:MAG: hypothetical protein IPK12_13430 [Gemmatimonadetes bacterium]|nr:hypothetical protein [Gemmatimonadota bacterium]